MRTLLVGASGQVGSAVKTLLLRERGHADCDCADERSVVGNVFYPRHSDLDITDASSVDAYCSDAKPDVIINCAAWTNVDGCEEDPNKAYAINAVGPLHLARAATSAGAWLIQISTDHCDCPVENVEGVYSLSKLEGELAAASCQRHTIVRTSWTLSAHSNGWLAYIIRNAIAGTTIRTSATIAYPTVVESLAESIIQLAKKPVPGIVAVAGSPAASKIAVVWAAISAIEQSGNGYIDMDIQEMPPGDTSRGPRRVDSRLNGPFYGERIDWRPWLKANASRIAREQAVAATATV